MNYEQARQVDPKSDRPDAGKWRWTVHNRRIGTYATGNCSGCDGHDTPEDAAEHQREYLIGNAEFVIVPDSEAYQLNRCEVEGCETFTASYMRIKGDGYRHDVVCPAHHTDKTKRVLIGVPGAAMYS